jgi:hypothetical protein
MSSLVVLLLLVEAWDVPERPPMRRESEIAWSMPDRPPMRRGPSVKIVGPIEVIPEATVAAPLAARQEPVVIPPCRVLVSLSPLPQQITERILNKRVSKSVMQWVVSLDNQCAEPVLVTESAILRFVPQLSPIDSKSMSLLIDEGAKNSGWARTSRLLADLGSLAAFAAASKTVRWGNDSVVGFTAAQFLVPYVIQRIKGVERPVRASWESLAWSQPVSLQPGEAITQRIFTAVWDNPQAINLEVDVAGVGSAKALK